MLAPCAASSRTTALPMPLFPPVTMATLPVRLMGLFLFCRSCWTGKKGCGRSGFALTRGCGENQVRDQGRPAGLVLRAETHTGVTVEVLVERDVVPPPWIGGQQV